MLYIDMMINNLSQPPHLHADIRTRDRVYRAVRDRLISGAYQPGEKIKIRPLAKALGTSTTPVREALLQLVSAGALLHDPQRSVRVPVLTPDEYEELIHFRILLECELAGIAAKRIAPAELELLENISIELLHRDPEDVEYLRSKIVEFHFTLYRAARMSKALPLVESLWLRTGPYLYLFGNPSDAGGHLLRGEILKGLRSGDAALVRKALKSDLTSARTFVTGEIKSKVK